MNAKDVGLSSRQLVSKKWQRMYSSSHYCGSSSVLAIHVAITNMRNTSLTAILDCVWVLSDKANRHGRLISINDISSTALERLVLHYTGLITTGEAMYMKHIVINLG